MKHLITFETTGAQSSGALLLHLAVILHQKRIDPEALSLTAGDGQGGRTSLRVCREQGRVNELADALRATVGVRRVSVTAELEPEPPPPITD